MPQTAQETTKRSRGFVGTLSAEDTARTKIKRTSMRAAKALLPRKENEMIDLKQQTFIADTVRHLISGTLVLRILQHFGTAQ